MNIRKCTGLTGKKFYRQRGLFHGPDSFLLHFVKKEMQGKPFLHLEEDEHSADAGLITRLEAFLDSLKGWKANQCEKLPEKLNLNENYGKTDMTSRTLYFPYARDSVHIMSAATLLIVHALPEFTLTYKNT